MRRAALVATLPWTKLTHPTPAETAARERILGWAAACVPDRDWFIQKAIGWWLRSLSAHDPDRVRAFLAGPGQGLKAFARREALAPALTASVRVFGVDQPGCRCRAPPR